MCLFQIRDVDDTEGAPIEVSQGESCSSGVCAGSVTLASGGEEGLEQGTTYIVSVNASNRYGVSQVSGNSDPFTIGASPDSGVCVCVCVFCNSSWPQLRNVDS